MVKKSRETQRSANARRVLSSLPVVQTKMYGDRQPHDEKKRESQRSTNASRV